jgi:hypothetical protein
MKVLRHTLVSDGRTDANLIPIINWTLKHAAGIELAEGVQADLWRMPAKPKSKSEQLLKAVDLHPCDVFDDFSPLRELPSFLAFEGSIKSLHDNGWKAGFYG